MKYFCTPLLFFPFEVVQLICIGSSSSDGAFLASFKDSKKENIFTSTMNRCFWTLRSALLGRTKGSFFGVDYSPRDHSDTQHRSIPRHREISSYKMIEL